VTARKPTPLAGRLAELRVTAAELAAVIGRPVELVEGWTAGDAEPDAEAKILLRVLDNPHAAELAVERIRNGHTRNLRSDAELYGGLPSAPYGTGDEGKATGGVPS
jgi:hypothetical protein